MNLIIDTHVLLWSIFAPKQLSALAKTTLKNTKNQIFVSSISLFEISIKFGLKKLDLDGYSPENILHQIEKMGFELLSPSAKELATVHQLDNKNHRDPFDRLIAWQAIQNNLTLITKDNGIRHYAKFGLKTLW